MLTKEEKIAKLKEWFNLTVLDKDVLQDTLNISDAKITPNALLTASAYLIKLNKKESPPHDRDNLKFSTFHGIEDFIKEKIDKDAGGVQKKAAMKMQQKKNLAWLHPSFFSGQIKSVVIGNSLSQNVEGINPIEHYDNSHRVTKLGQGGIASIEAIPDSSRQVAVSSFGFFDPLHIPEGINVGVTNYISQNVVKGRDKKLYRIMKDNKGKLGWYSHEDVLSKKVEIPNY